MYFYFDTEFTGLHRGTTLMSIGIIRVKEADTSQTSAFYAEFTDYDKSQVDDWIHNNVEKNFLFKDKEAFVKYDNPNDITIVKGNKEEVKKVLLNWLSEQYCTIQMVSDVCHYDFCLLTDLIAPDCLSLPEYFSPTCHDINQDIAKFYGINEIHAFDISREEFEQRLVVPKLVQPAETKLLSFDIQNKHNALYDALNIATIGSFFLEE